MKLALLGCDEETLALVREAIAEGEHALVAAYDTAEFKSQVQSLASSARLDEDWETLLLGNVADVVIVARGRLDPSRATGFAADERRNDQLRKLVQEAVPLVVIHPGCEALVGFELDMIRSDSKGIILPFALGRNQAALEAMANLVRGSETSLIGSVEQILFEREMTSRRRPKVLAQLARDVSFAREFLGPIHKMSATGAAVGETVDPLGPRSKTLPPLDNLSVHLSGEQPFAARWTVMPAEHVDKLQVTMIGARGRAVLAQSSGLAPSAVLKVSGGGSSEITTSEFPSQNEFGAALNIVSQNLAGPGRQESSWLAACRDVEVAESVDRSLARGRAVEFFGEEHSEEQSFKGVMAVGGCLMLSVTFVALLIAAAVEGLQLPLRESALWRAWPFYLLVPIVLFLLLQLLQGVAKRPEKQSQNEEAGQNLPAA
ncbi:MAG: hypothetical protein ACR2FY_07935 [Pirellulaceae bacterium]